MIPQRREELRQPFSFSALPGRTFPLHRGEDGAGLIDGAQAVKQAVFLMLNVERYEWLIYSWNYGFEREDLLGKPMDFCLPELERRIREALLQDDRITAVEDFRFEVEKRKVLASFTVVSTFAPIAMETEVEL